MPRPTIALACIMKNESKNIPILLKSVEGCFDEVHITDTGSSDDSVHIAESLGAQVHHFPWINDFSAARNASISPIKTDYIMWMDLDDSMGDKESFIKWRDSVMETVDYWLAAYHYASNSDGVPVCTFTRERVFKNDGRFNFKYFVHEGLVPKEGLGPIKMGFVQTWSVNHRRTQEDLAKDRGRNLRLFEFHKDNLDNRMKFYYGKEFFENGDPVSAVRWLKEAICETTLEMHDRLLGTQYLIYSYIQTNQMDQAVSVALNGLQLFPQRAEFWVSIGDAFIKQGKIVEALPFFHAAKGCSFVDPVETRTSQPVFSSKEAYTFYPRNQIARIHANTNQFDSSLKELNECLDLFPNPESETMKKEVSNIVQIRPGSKTVRKKVDDIVITGTPGGPYEWDWDIYKSKGIGGSETAAVEMAHWMRKLSGRRVIVFNNRSQSKNIDGVDYLPIQQAPQYFGEHTPYFHVAWRHNFKLTDAPTYLWNHDLMIPGGENHINYKRALVLSDFHKSFLHTIQGVPEDKIRITRNGVDPERFVGINQDNFPKLPIVVWRSSPDRGLERAISVMEEVRKEMALDLYVYYGFDNMYKNNAGKHADELKAMIAARPWIHFKGNVEQKQLSRECAQAMVWLYPTDFAETYCIGAIESLCEGVYPIVRNYGGLRNTLKEPSDAGYCTLVDHDCVTPEQVRKYANEVISAVREKKWEKIQVKPDFWSWQSLANQWLDWFEEDK